MTAAAAASAIAEGRLTAEALVLSCLDRISLREPEVGAWIYLNADNALAEARRLDRLPSDQRGPLFGIPIGLKDIIDTVDMPTAYGAGIYHGHQPAADAVCATMARRAGVIVLGKTVSTEFAFRYPGKTSNPHNRAHTPGGSSSGSAAAVADQMVPLAIGTQTGGSVIRPASYCGIYAIKPTYGQLSFSGVRHLAESFDTLGVMARSIDDLVLFHHALLGLKQAPATKLENTPRIALCRTPHWGDADPAMQKMFEAAASRLASAGATVCELPMRDDQLNTLEATWVVNRFEGSRTFAFDRDRQPFGVSAAVRQIVDEGLEVGWETYTGALKRIEQLRRDLDQSLAGFDVILTPSAAGEAPKGLSDTGPIAFNYIWTHAHLPCLTMPHGKGAAGLPLGVQLVARRHEEPRLFEVARWVAQTLG
jgi:amidase